MARTLGPPRVIRSVSLSWEFDSLCRKNNISISEACRVGISLMLAEAGVSEYDNNLNLHRKMRMFQKMAEELSGKCTPTTNEEERESTKSVNN